MGISAPIPANEAQRLQSLESYHVLDTGRERAYDDLTLIASEICGTPMALVSLVDRDRQWFKSSVGLSASETPREVSFCAHAILQDDLFIVPDTAEDIRFHDNVLVTAAPRLRFYAGAVLHTADGHALGTLCVLDSVPRTLTEGQKNALRALARQAMAQLEMRRSLEMAERVIRYRSRLMAVIGHDLMQPVNVISMVLQLLNGELSESDTENLSFAAAAVDTLSKGLGDLAHASRLDQESVKIAKFPLQSVLDGLTGNWGLRARQKGLSFRVDPSNETIESDERMLLTILGNLVGNAIKYTITGGISVETVRDRDDIKITVSDTGVGIPREQLNTIFESFRQLDSGNSEGLGLGLAIVQRTAELLGYSIDVKSDPGQGSQFTVTIPPRAYLPE
jgi:signal transduction histidine kinase